MNCAILPLVLPVVLCPLITDPHLEGTNLVLSVKETDTNSVYQWQSTTNLTGEWQNEGPAFQGTETPVWFYFPMDGPQRFFRVMVTVP